MITMESNRIYVQQPSRSSVRAWIPRGLVTSEVHQLATTAIAALSVWGNYDNSNATHYTYEFSDELGLHGVVHVIEKLYHLITRLDHESTENVIIKIIT